MDHLGNARLVFTAKDADGVVDVTGSPATNEVLQEHHYYPFGLNTEDPWMNDAALNNRYQYNGKEWNDDHGLNWFDYGARWYDPSVGRWWSVDPLCAKMGSFSTYNYGFNNPVRFIDVGGLAPSDPPNGKVSWVWFTPRTDVNGNHYKRANYQNVSEQAAKEWNQYNAQNGGNGGAITETTHGYLESGQNRDAVGYEVPDPAGGTTTTDQTKEGVGPASFDVALPTKATEADVSVSYDFYELEDNMSVNDGDKSGTTGNQANSTNSPMALEGAQLETGNKNINVSITPMSPNTKTSKDPNKVSHWQVTVNYSTNVPVYSSKNANSTRPNSTSGEALGGYRQD